MWPLIILHTLRQRQIKTIELYINSCFYFTAKNSTAKKKQRQRRETGKIRLKDVTRLDTVFYAYRILCLAGLRLRSCIATLWTKSKIVGTVWTELLAVLTQAIKKFLRWYGYKSATKMVQSTE